MGDLREIKLINVFQYKLLPFTIKFSNSVDAELSNNKLWDVKEFFKSNYIVNKDVNAWLCLSEMTK